VFLCVPARVCVYKDLCKERNKMESAIDLLHCVSVQWAKGGCVVLSIRKCAVDIYICALLILVGEVEAGKTCLLRALRSVYLRVYIYT